MNMPEGYQVLEPPSLAPLLANPRGWDVAVAALYWVIDELRLELAEHLDGVRLEVIRVEYQGAYPALGVQYLVEMDDLGPLIEDAVDQIVLTRPASSLFRYVGSSGRDWHRVAAELLGRW